MEQVIIARGKFHAHETVWAQILHGDIFAFLLVHKFCDIVAILLVR
jgi:hypothetical protein